MDAPYADLESSESSIKTSLEVTLLPQNAFRGYMLRQQAAGADLAHLKPPHINPSDGIIDCLVNGLGKATVSSKQEHQLETIRSK